MSDSKGSIWERVFATYARADNTPPPPSAKATLELTGDTMIKHASGAYIRFTPEGNIFIVAAPKGQICIGAGELPP